MQVILYDLPSIWERPTWPKDEEIDEEIDDETDIVSPYLTVLILLSS